MNTLLLLAADLHRLDAGLNTVLGPLAVCGLLFAVWLLAFSFRDRPPERLRPRRARSAPALSGTIEIAMRVPGASRCAYCHGSDEEACWPCATCNTALHEECWTLAETCPTLGCAGLGRG
ncbi:MAG: hypothetical protein JKY65_12945 [Planctomycetes bacterium]|nr:hypothetical protein [Planctomycetota bacterium]